MEQPLVSVIIVNWNGRHLLGECLDSLAKQEFRDFEVILVDNGSEDGSAQFVQEQYPAVRLVSLPHNVGFAGGNNAGIRIATGQYIAFLNNDTKTDPAWLKCLTQVAAAASAQTGMWAGKILSYNAPDVIDSAGLLLYPDALGRGRGRLEKDDGQYDHAEEVFFPSGCAGMFRRKVLDEIGLFDEDFFAYADDVDLGLRARIAGWRCTYAPAARIYHKYSASSSAYSPFKAFLVERNRILVLMKCFPCELVPISLWFTFLRLVLQLYGAVTGRGASGKFSEQHSVFRALGIMLKAWFAALAAFPRILRQRNIIARTRKIGRRELYRLLCRYRLSAAEVALKE